MKILYFIALTLTCFTVAAQTLHDLEQTVILSEQTGDRASVRAAVSEYIQYLMGNLDTPRLRERLHAIDRRHHEIAEAWPQIQRLLQTPNHEDLPTPHVAGPTLFAPPKRLTK